MTLASAKISVIIPALNEQGSIGKVIADIPRGLADEIIVVDNGSRDATVSAAKAAGARVVMEPYRGYGAACLAGIAAAARPDIIVFLDGDYSDYPEDMQGLVAPVIAGEADLVIGSRISGGRGRGALPPQAYWGNKFAVMLIRALFGGCPYTDLGPFRAISCHSLQLLDMQDRNFGWTVEMQVKAVQRGLRILEVPVRYRKRIGTSKISGTVSGTVKAGTKIIYSIARLKIKSIRLDFKH